MRFNYKNIICGHLFGFVFALYLNKDRTEKLVVEATLSGKLLNYIDTFFGGQSVFPINIKVLDFTMSNQAVAKVLIAGRIKDNKPWNGLNKIKNESVRIFTRRKEYLFTDWYNVFCFSNKENVKFKFNKKISGFTRFCNISQLLKHPKFVG